MIGTGLVLLATALGSLGVTAAEDAWQPVTDKSLKIVRASALDFSFLATETIAGEKGLMVAAPGGHLAFAESPDAPVRFHCASLAWSPASGSYPDHATADLYAEQLRLHGYNLARLHFVDANLMSGRVRDFDLDPAQLDNFRYLLAALKRNGIRWMIDAATSENGGYGNVQPHRWEARYGHKIDVHVSEAARKHWLRLASSFLGSLNPYTGLRPLDDPALAIVTTFNEDGLEYASLADEPRTHQVYPETLRTPFNAWLATQYGNTSGLAKPWAGELAGGESLELRTVGLPRSRGATGRRMRDLQRFFLEREEETYLWMTTALRQLGYRGITTAYNNWTTSEAQLSRRKLSLVSTDSYHDIVFSLEPGTTIEQSSSLDDDLKYVREMMATRWLGRPFVVSEYDHLFWNTFRHEAGVAVPAYAALQGWDGLCRHGSGAVDLAYGSPYPHKQKLLPYNIGMDPIARASETLSALLFARGDVKASPQRLAIPLAGEKDFIADGQGRLPDDLTRLGLITGLGLSQGRSGEAAQAGQAAALPPPREAGALPRWLEKTLDRVSGAAGQRLAKRLDTLTATGAIDAETAKLAQRRAYRSDTGEILADAAARTIQVVTPMTEAVSFATLQAPLRLGRMTLEAASEPALVSVSSLDGAPLATSRKLLLILSTDAMNSGMTFSDAGRRTVTDYGRLPVLLRTGSVHLSLALAPPQGGQPERPRLSALHLDGTVAAMLPVNRQAETIRFTIETASSRHGATTFFLLER